MKIRLLTGDRKDHFNVHLKATDTVPMWFLWANSHYRFEVMTCDDNVLIPVYCDTKGSPEPGQVYIDLGLAPSQEMLERPKVYPFEQRIFTAKPAGDTATEILARQGEAQRKLGGVMEGIKAAIQAQTEDTMILVIYEQLRVLHQKYLDKGRLDTHDIITMCHLAPQTSKSSAWRDTVIHIARKELGYLKGRELDESSFDKGHAEGYALGRADGEKDRNVHYAKVIKHIAENHAKALDAQFSGVKEVDRVAYERGRAHLTEQTQVAYDEGKKAGYAQGEQHGYATGQLRGQDEGYARAKREIHLDITNQVEEARHEGYKRGEHNGFQLATKTSEKTAMEILYPNTKATYDETDAASHKLPDLLKSVSVSVVENGYSLTSWVEGENKQYTFVFIEQEDALKWLAKNLA